MPKPGQLLTHFPAFSGPRAGEPMPPQAQLFIAAAVVILVVACIAAIHFNAVADLTKTTIKHLRKAIMTAQQDIIDATTKQLSKVLGEVTDSRDALLDEIKTLKDQIAAGTPAPELDLTGLTDVAQRLDDLTPDTEPTEPTEPEGDLTLTKWDDTDDK